MPYEEHEYEADKENDQPETHDDEEFLFWRGIFNTRNG
jgi:hypothetical protein